MKRKRVILVAGESLFESGVRNLLEGKGEQLEIERAADVKAAVQLSETFRPEVVIFFKDKGTPEDEALLHELVSRYHSRVIHCTLEANQLTIYNKTNIQNVTVDDLMSAVLN